MPVHSQIMAAERGENVIYWNGLLMLDVDRSSKAIKVREAAWSCYRAGACALVQRRIGEGDYEYIAQRL